MDFLNRIIDKFSPSKNDIVFPPNPFPGFLDTVQPKQQFQVTLSKIQKISPDSYIYTYDLPDPNVPLGLRCGHHVNIQYKNLWKVRLILSLARVLRLVFLLKEHILQFLNSIKK